MSADTPTGINAEPQPFGEHIGPAHQWQIPLLLVATGLLVISLLQLRPPTPLPSFEEHLEPLQRMMRAGLYDLVVADAGALLREEELGPLQEARLYVLMAEATHLAEGKRRRHHPENAQWIIRNLQLAEDKGFTPTGENRCWSAAAWEWLGNPQRALDDYQLALWAGVDDALVVERHIMDLKGELNLLSNEEHHRLLDRYMGLAQDAPDEFVWALRAKIDLHHEAGDREAARALLDRAEPQLRKLGRDDQADLLDAMLWYREERFDEAERLLRSLRAKLEVRNETYAQATCLLARLNLRDDRPYEALSFCEDILESYTSGPYLATALLISAETQALLRYHERAVACYRELIAMLPFGFDSKYINEEMIRTSLAVQYDTLRHDARPSEALLFIELANEITDSAPESVQAVFLKWLIEAHVALAEQYQRQADAAKTDEGTTTEDESHGAGADNKNDPAALMRRHYRRAAEASLRLAKPSTSDEEVATEALWMAAEYYDRAGEAQKTIEVLREFVRTRTTGPLIPLALLRLGQSYQAAGMYAEAIDTYRRNLSEYPRTPAALESAVPMARCYLTLGDDHFKQAEQVLRSLLDQSAEPEALVLPSAKQYREALFFLGEMYVQAREYEKAISMLEERLTRYPNDPRASVTRFVLADSYRLSALALRGDAESPDAGPARLRLLSEHKRRLRRAHDLFAQAAAEFEKERTDLSEKAREEYLHLSLSYQADCLFDLGLYGQALPLYEEISWRRHHSPTALSAYIQIVSCYQRMGQMNEAVTALKRAKQLVGRIPEDRFEQTTGGMTRREWELFLARVEDSPLFRQ
ncbi:MAG: tetratricopeptide repeat protein [Phycisphaerales bacterium]|nr:MAG: tetratricopeptide repeat protein [Phycisphaerales bacterium]